MARTIDGNTSNYLAATDADVARPRGQAFAFSVDFTVQDLSSDRTIVGKYVPADLSAEYILRVSTFTGLVGAVDFFILQATGLGRQATSAAGVISADDAWHNAYCVCNASVGGSGNMYVYIDGTLVASNTCSRISDGGADVLRLGQRGDGVPHYGRIAEFAYWHGDSGSTTDMDNAAAALAGGINPNLVRETPTHHWPIWGDADPEGSLCGNTSSIGGGGINSNVGGVDIDVIGTCSKADHAPVGYPWPFGGGPLFLT